MSNIKSLEIVIPEPADLYRDETDNELSWRFHRVFQHGESVDARTLSLRRDILKVIREVKGTGRIGDDRPMMLSIRDCYASIGFFQRYTEIVGNEKVVRYRKDPHRRAWPMYPEVSSSEGNDLNQVVHVSESDLRDANEG